MFNDKKNTSANQLGERNIIAKNTSLIGDITSDGDFRVDGSIEGTIKTTGKVFIGKEGAVKGTVDCANADIEGAFSGKLMVEGTLSLKSTANINGDVILGKLSVEPGATFNATCTMKNAVKTLLNDQQESQKTA